MEFEIVIGLEIHVQVATQSKLFCGCLNAFGNDPNTQVCPTCLGYPGALPVINREAVRQGIRAGLAFGCAIAPRARFDRKNYFYPDLPKGYQTTQNDFPYALGGAIDFEWEGQTLRLPLVRIHLEEDAGKSIHDRKPGKTALDLNRCGTPLLEIVTKPGLSEPSQAAAAVREVRDRVRWVGVSDANLEQGSLRADVNLSLRRPGEGLGVRTEIKNLNSFASIERAAEVESKRQAEVLRRGESVVQETRSWDPDREITKSMRSKEDAHDYRYFPEPDLLPYRIPNEVVESERGDLPESAQSRLGRYQSVFALTASESLVLVSEREGADYFEAVVAAGGTPKSVSNWIQGDLRRELNERGWGFADWPVSPADFATLLLAVDQSKVSVANGRKVLTQAASGKGSVKSLLSAQGEQLSDPGELATWVQEAIESDPDAAAKVRAGDPKAIQALVGKVMKASRGKANPRVASQLLSEALGPDPAH